MFKIKENDAEKRFRCLEDQLNWILLNIQEYKKIFYVDDKFNGLIAETTAPGFFGIYNRLFWYDIILSISRLLDENSTNPTKDKNKTLSLDYLIHYAKTNDLKCLSDIKKTVSDLRKNYKLKCWRDKVIAHTDWKVSVKEDLFEINLSEIEDYAEKILKCFNDVRNEAFNMTVSGNITVSDGADVLMFLLEKSLKNDK